MFVKPQRLLLMVAVALLLVGWSSAAPAPLPRQRAIIWDSVRRLGRMGNWHYLMAISPDGRQLLLGGSTDFVIYDLPAGKVVHEVRTEESVQGAAFSPDGKLLVTAEWRDGFKLRDARTMKVRKTITGSAKLGAWEARFSRNGKRLFCYTWWSSKTQLFCYDLTQNKEIHSTIKQNQDTPQKWTRAGFRGLGPYLFSVERRHNNGYYNGYRVQVTDA
jgi:WD40 repeat protein